MIWHTVSVSALKNLEIVLFFKKSVVPGIFGKAVFFGTEEVNKLRDKRLNREIKIP